MRLRCGSLSITIPVSLLVEWFDVQSLLHGQVSLAAVNQILSNSWGYERLQKSKDLLKDCFENVNIWKSLGVNRITYAMLCGMYGAYLVLIWSEQINKLSQSLFGYPFLMSKRFQTTQRVELSPFQKWNLTVSNWYLMACPSKHVPKLYWLIPL